MRNPLDQNNISLAKTLLRLRQNIDIHRIIGLNKSSLHDVPLPGAFLGHLQQQCLICIALDMCKVYEPQKRYPLNSIPGILHALEDAEAQPEAEEEAVKFSREYGISYSNRTDSIREAFTQFSSSHAPALEMMKTVRDKYAAHSEYSFSPEALPSHDEFELLWSFGRDFYKCVSRGWIGVHPALFGRHASMSFFRHIESVARKKLIFDFQ